MYDFKEQIDKQLGFIDFLIEEAENRSKACGNPATRPKGALICRKRRYKFYYYLQQYIFAEGKRSRKEVYIGAAEAAKVRNIKACEFYARRLEVLRADKALLMEMASKFQGFAPWEIHKSLPQAYKDLPDECYVDSNCVDMQEWAKQRYKKNPREMSNTSNITVTGEHVRSKGEVIIFDLLIHHQIPFRYECCIRLKTEAGRYENRYPDFTFTTKSGEKIIWEHFGMMDNKEYRDDNFKKIYTYLLNGYVIGDNLILTSDAISGGINSRSVNYMIKEYLLERLND